MGWWLLFQTITIMKHSGFFSLYWFYLCAEKKNEREPSLRLSVFNELREEAERKRFCWRFFSLLVSPILLFLIFLNLIKKENKTEKHTHTGRKNKQMLFFYTPCEVLNYAEEKWQLEREEKQHYVRWQTSSAEIGCDTLSHACTGSVYVAFIIWKNFFPSVMFLTSSRWIYDVVYIGKVV